MPRETVRAKALRLVAEGRVRVLRADRHSAQVGVRGDSGTKYLVLVDRGESECECRALRRTPCSHRRAALLVTAAGIPDVETER